MKILVVNGPNLNFLGIREKDIYGSRDYNYLLGLLEQKAVDMKATIEVFQSNSEGEIIDRLQKAYNDKVDGIVINPGAYTHYSYAIRDALSSIDVPKIEVHISNIYKREEFRQKSVTAAACSGQISGLGLKGYLLAIDAIADMTAEKEGQ
jgi:3-dehydroquinate dehydratase-2